MKKTKADVTKDKKKKGFNLTRRKFLKLSGITGAFLWVAHKTIEDTGSPLASPIQKKAQNAEERWVVTSCLNCSGRCGIRVRVVNHKAVKITGNPYSQLSEGKVCPRAHVGLQVLYDPDRIVTPLKRTSSEKGRRIDPQWKPISWDQALEEISRNLRILQERLLPHQLLLFSGLNSRSSEDLLSRFAEAFGTPNLVTGDGLDWEAEKAGNWMADGHFEMGVYDLDHTNYILSFGADLLESTPPVARWLRKWGKFRREKTIRTKVVSIQPWYSLTASKSDEWIPIKPGTDGALAMGIAHVLIQEDIFDHSFIKEWTVGFDQYRKMVLQDYKPEAVSKVTGIPTETIYRIAREFAQTRPALAIPGKGAIAWPGGSYVGFAIRCLNALVGSIDIPGGILYQEQPEYREIPKVPYDEIAKKGLEQTPIDLRGTNRFLGAKVVTNQIPISILDGKPYPIEMAIGFNSNFNMMAPSPGYWEEALKKIPFYVHVSPFASEMAQFADLLLPSTTYLEEWGYDHTSSGAGSPEVRIKQPVVKPMGESKSVGEILFLLAERVPCGVAKAFKEIGSCLEEFVRFRISSLQPWEEFLKRGVWKGQAYQYRKYQRLFHTPSKKFEFISGNLLNLQNRKGIPLKEGVVCFPHNPKWKWLGEETQYPLILLPYQPLLTFENGSQNYPWAQEIFLPMQGIGWASPAQVHTETAQSLK
ncbi:MAG: molybdopterin-containing oxidoreductase family protein, partial [Thermodesulfobacteriota bacterium]